MRELGGRLWSLLTNYDQTILALVLGGLEGRSSLRDRPCTALPCCRVAVIELTRPSRRYLATLNVALAEAKLIDDVEDESRGRLLRRVGLKVLRGKARQAAEDLARRGFPVHLIAALPGTQRRLERAGGSSATLESLATPSGSLTGEILAFAGVLTGKQALVGDLRGFGQALGHYVYVWDAWEDRDEDRRQGRFNAVDSCFGERDHAATRAAVRLYLRRQLARLDVGLAILAAHLGPQASVLRHLLASLRDNVDRRLPRTAEAGAFDCGDCDLGGCVADTCQGGVGTDPGPCACDGCMLTAGSDKREQRERHREEEADNPSLPPHAS